MQYLRVKDLAVELRRGEIRHRSSRQVTHVCMHRVGRRDAKHSGAFFTISWWFDCKADFFATQD